MKIRYGKNWSYGQKKILGELTIAQAEDRFKNKERLVLFIPQDMKVVILGRGSIEIEFLDANFELEATFRYQLVLNEKIESNKYFLWSTTRFIKNEVGDPVRQLNTNYLIFNHSSSSGWMNKLLEFGKIEDVDIQQNKYEYYFDDKKVDLNSLYMDIPEFGHWGGIREQGKNKVRFLNE